MQTSKAKYSSACTYLCLLFEKESVSRMEIVKSRELRGKSNKRFHPKIQVIEKKKKSNKLQNTELQEYTVQPSEDHSYW